MPHQHGQHREHLHNPTGLTDTAVSQGHDFIEHAEHEEEQVSHQRHEANLSRSWAVDREITNYRQSSIINRTPRNRAPLRQAVVTRDLRWQKK